MKNIVYMYGKYLQLKPNKPKQLHTNYKRQRGQHL